jgi:hypothetical protein
MKTNCIKARGGHSNEKNGNLKTMANQKQPRKSLLGALTFRQGANSINYQSKNGDRQLSFYNLRKFMEAAASKQ